MEIVAGGPPTEMCTQTPFENDIASERPVAKATGSLTERSFDCSSKSEWKTMD